MLQRIAVYHTSFDPPTIHHRTIAERLAGRFDRVIILPSGPRPTRCAMPDSPTVYRATMADLNFRGIPNLTVDLSDLEQQRYSYPQAILDRYAAADSDVWLVVNGDWVRDGGRGDSIIQKEWHDGPKLWACAGFVVLKERGLPWDPTDQPPRCELFEHDPNVSSEAVRSMLNQGETAATHYLQPSVERYIQRHSLFRDVRGEGQPVFRPTLPQFQLYLDEWNDKSKNIGELLERYTTGEPEMILGIGGDGTMLRAIRKHWRERLPFYGINTGHLGFLLSGRDITAFWKDELLLYHLPLLQVEVETMDGQKQEAVAFNEAWIERDRGQTAWIRVSVNGVERIKRLVGDGVLVSTAAGSTSYARAMGASPVPLNTSVLLLVGSNVLQPAFWRPVVLPMDAVIELEPLNTSKRPARGYYDGEEFHGSLRKMTIRVSRTASVELAFNRGHDPFAKLAEVQFPLEN